MLDSRLANSHENGTNEIGVVMNPFLSSLCQEGSQLRKKAELLRLAQEAERARDPQTDRESCAAPFPLVNGYSVDGALERQLDDCRFTQVESGTMDEIDFCFDILGTQIIHRDSDATQGKQEIDAPQAAELRRLAGAQPAQLVELGCQEEGGLPGELSTGKAGAQENVVAVVDGQLVVHDRDLVYLSQKRIAGSGLGVPGPYSRS